MALFLRVCDTYELLQKQLIVNLENSFQKDGVSPLTSIPVIVPNLGIGRAVRQALARQNGIDANVSFGYLAEWTWSELKRLDKNFRSIEGLQGDALVWRIDHYLAQPEFVSQYPRLLGYVEGADRRKRWQLAQHIAALFTRYNAYRLDWVQAWIVGKDPADENLHNDEDYGWQRALWERLGNDLELAAIHPADALYRDAGQYSTATDLHVFIPQNVPPLYLRLLARLSRGRDVYVYLKNPCSAFWLDIQKRRGSDLDDSQGSMHWQALDGHPLLASWATQTKSMYELFYSYIDEGQADTENLFYYEKFLKDDYAPSSNLERLQHSIAKLDPRLMDGMESCPQDRSLEVHSCYSPMREVEALQDYLYSLFEIDPTLKASDVIVITPDIDRMAPMIDAVFGVTESKRRIEYRIQGRAVLKDNDCASALSLLMKLFTSEVKASDVLLLLSNRAVSHHFELNDSLQTIEQYLQQAGFREGMNTESLREKGFESIESFSFEKAVDRLMFGFAKPQSFSGVTGDLIVPTLPYQTTVPQVEVLTAVSHVFEVLNDLYQQSKTEKNANEWRQWLVSALGTLTGSEAFSEQRIECLNVFDRMVHDQGLADVADEAAPLSIIRSIFDSHFAQSSAGATPSSGVTFTNMNSLHGLSYRVVCVLGLNEGSFPKVDRADDFDLMARFPRIGDRQRLRDDRNTFFDWLMDSQDYFYVSYCGRSNVDGCEKNASILIEEMLDVITANQSQLCSLPYEEQKAYRDRWILQHPLHAFSLSNFVGTDIRVIRRDPSMIERIEKTMATEASWPTFWSSDKALPYESQDARVRLDDLVKFWSDPLLWMWQHRLRLKTHQDMQALKDRESYRLDGLTAWSIKDRYLKAILSQTFDEPLERLRAQNDPSLAVMPLSEKDVEEAIDSANGIASKVRELSGDECQTTEAVFLEVGDVILEGNIENIYGNHLIEARVGRLKPKYLMSGLIRLACLQSHQQESVTLRCLYRADAKFDPSNSQKMGDIRGYSYKFPNQECARRFLVILLEGYFEGQKRPLPIAPGLILMDVCEEEKHEAIIEAVFDEMDVESKVLLPQRGLSEAAKEALLSNSRVWAQRLCECLGWSVS